VQPLGSGTPGVRDEAPRPPLRDQRIGDGKVVKERFVGLLARLVSGQVIGRVGWRAGAGRCGGEAQVGEDLPDDRRTLDDGDDFHRPAALGTEQRIDLVDLADQARPRSAHLQGSPIALIGGWVRR
jgi:hypothetical protein